MIGSVGNIWNGRIRIMEGAQTRKRRGVKTGVHYAVGFFLAGLLHFYWSLARRRGALEKGMEYSSRAAVQQERTGQRERAGEQRKRTIHLPWGDWMRDTGEEERKESEKKIKDRWMIIPEVVVNNSYPMLPLKWTIQIIKKKKQGSTYSALTTLQGL